MAYNTPDGNNFTNAKSVFKHDQILGTLDENLWFKLFENISLNLSYIERTDWYLSDNRIIENVFVIGSRLVYYYCENPYFTRHMGDYSNIPRKSINEEFGFNENEILLIKLNNRPKFSKKISFFNKILLNNVLTHRENIKLNDIVRISEKWDVLPDKSSKDLFRSVK